MALIDTGFWTARGFLNVAPVPRRLPTGRMVDIPGRGATLVTDTGPVPGKPDAPALLLLHAVSCTGLLTWYPTIPELSRTHRVITMDMRWHGHGPRSEEFALEDCADDAVALADVLGIDRFMVAGYSMGGLVAQLIWRRHPERVLGMVLASTSSTFRKAPFERVALDAFTRGLDPLRLGPGDRPLASTERQRSDNSWAFGQFRQTSPSAMSRAAAVIVKYDSRKWLHEVDVPTSVVITTRDRVIRPDRQYDMAGEIQGSSVYEIDAGHASCVMAADVFVPAFKAATASVTGRIDRTS